MVSYLDLLNKARAKNNEDDISVVALQSNTQGSASNVQHVDDVVAYAYEQSQDWSFNDIIVDVNTTANVATVSTTGLTTVWEPDAIKEVKLVKNNTKKDLYLLTPSRVDDIEDQFNNAEPIYWYIDNQELKLFPIPDAVYTLSVRYQGLIPEVTVNNISDTIVIPRTLQIALVEGIYSRLLFEDGDSDWEKWEQRWLKKLSDALSRNRSNYNRNGVKFWRYKQSADFTL